jgi:hypothetical protein
MAISSGGITGDINTTGNFNSTGNLSVTGLTTLKDLTVTGTFTSSGSESATSLTLTGAGTALTVNNNASLGSLSVVGTGVITAGTTLTLKGNAPATGGVGVVLDNATAITSGKNVSFRDAGTEYAYFDQNGTLNFLGSAGITTATGTLAFGSPQWLYVSIGSGAGAYLRANANATSDIAFKFDNYTTQTSGKIASFQTGGSEVASVGPTGIITSGTTSSGTAAGFSWGTGTSLYYDTGVSALRTSNSLVIDNPGFLQVGNYLQSNYLYALTTSLTLSGEATAAGPGLIMQNAIALTSGKIVSFKNNSSEVASIDLAGRLGIVSYNDSTGSAGNVSTNAITGRAAIASGANTCVVSNTSVNANSIILLTMESTATGVANVVVSARSASTSFTVKSVNGTGVVTNTTGNTNFSWMIIS